MDNSPEILELDELYWYIKKRGRSETKENVYIITMVSRNPRLIVGFDAALDKSPGRIQEMADSAAPSETYYTDGYLGYLDVIYPGDHVRNIRDKSETYTVEGVNADLRHYIPILARKSRCFSRKLDTLYAVLAVFVEAYNQFGIAKYKHRLLRPKGELPFSVVDFL